MNNVAYIPETPAFVVEVEQIVLGTVLLNPDMCSMVRGGIDAFFDPKHRELMRVIYERDRQGLLVSPVALREWANANMQELGGARYLVNLASVASVANFPEYVDVLSENRAKREILTAIQDAQAAIIRGEDTATAIAGRLEGEIANVQPPKKAAPVSMMTAVTKAMKQVSDAFTGDGDQAVRTGIHALDSILSGMFGGDLILLGGRPSMGKTALALSIALNVARSGRGVGIASLEMGPEALALRAVSEATSQRGQAVQYSKMRSGELDALQLDSMKIAAGEVAELPITFLSRDYSELGAMIGGVKQIKRTMGDSLAMIIIDYAQLLTVKADSRYDEITKISRALKSLASQIDIPIIALSQLSRQLESRQDKRPQLSDLRESGQLEQDADAVLFAYRDEYYLERERPPIGSDQYERWEGAMERAKNRLEVIVAKQRQGKIGTAHMFCNPALNRIWED